MPLMKQSLTQWMNAAKVILSAFLVMPICPLCTVAMAEADTPPLPGADWRDPKFKDIRITLPPFEGVHYEAEIPDTLELSERAVLSINAMTRLVNPEFDYAQYTWANLHVDPPVLMMGVGGFTNLNPKWMASLPLMRLMSGSTVNVDIDCRIAEGLLHQTGLDGLTYQPVEHPGAFYDDFTRAQGKPAADIGGESRQLMALSIWTQISPDPLFRKVAERKIDRLLEIAVSTEGGSYFRQSRGYTPGQKNTDQIPIFAITDSVAMDPKLGIVGTASARTEGYVALGAARYYLATGYEPALELARGTAYYFKDQARVIEQNGRWHGWHFHIMARAILGALTYGIAAKDEEMLTWAQRAYEYGRSIGDPTLGFFATIPGCDGKCAFNPNPVDCGKERDRVLIEPCTVSDMALIALRLSRAGISDYYEDVEHYVRNSLVESQITDLDFLKTYPKVPADSEAGKAAIEPTLKVGGRDLRKLNWDNAAERSVGSFLCILPNKWGSLAACGCCTGNGPQALYYVWDSIVQTEGDNLRINLLLNRASPWCDIDSYLPYEGKLVVNMKQDKNVYIRIPSWTDLNQVRCVLDDRPIHHRREGNYIVVESLKRDDELLITFPMMEKTLYRKYGDRDYFLTVRGFTVTDLEPHANVTPVFKRGYYRRPKAPMRKIGRFIANREIIW